MQKYIDFYRQYAVTLDAFLTALDTLAEEVLSTPIIDPVTLQTYIATIEDQLIVDTNYEPVFKDIYEFYAHRLVTFTNFDDMFITITSTNKIKSASTYVTIFNWYSSSTNRHRNL